VEAARGSRWPVPVLQPFVITPDESAAVAASLARARCSIEARIAEQRQLFDGILESDAAANIDDEHDPEGATIAFERAQVTALIERAHRDLEALDRAEERLADGSYGTCRSCGRAIAPERLLALPSVELCIACADRGR
jgi:DnaK suppressor protein